MPAQDDKFYLGHRERLKEKFLDNKLTEYEQLELLLSFAIPRRDVRPLSRKLIDHFGSVYYVIIAEYDDLIAVPGVGRSTAILIKLVCSLISISHVKKLTNTPIFQDHVALEEYCRMKLAAKSNEEFHVLYLDGKFKLIEHEVHSQGSIESSNVYIDKIIQRALNKGAKSLVLLHNHPASDNMFSSQDVELTQNIITTLQPCGIRLYDHFVIAGGIMHSLRATGLLNQSGQTPINHQ
jgi:DNA repair protein RadC